jgi:ribonuclease HI
MTQLLLFTDGSVNTKSGVGFGAYLAVEAGKRSIETYCTKVNVRRFGNTSSTKLELQTLLWALGEVGGVADRFIIHTDSQSIPGLLRRRVHLENHGFRSNAGRLLNNHELYQTFFTTIDQLDCEFVKVKGHKPSQNKDSTDRLFTLVDRAARTALRETR